MTDPTPARGFDSLAVHAGQAFDPTTGARLWSVQSAGEGVVPSPVVAGGLVVTVSGFGAPAIRAVRPGVAPAVAWEQTKGVPMQASPAVSDGLVFVVSDAGILSALDQSTGAQVWQQRLEGAFSASPVVADSKAAARRRWRYPAACSSSAATRRFTQSGRHGEASGA